MNIQTDESERQIPDNDSVTGSYGNSWQQEESDCHQGHVQFPMPGFREIYPALGSIVQLIRQIGRQLIKWIDS